MNTVCIERMPPDRGCIPQRRTEWAMTGGANPPTVTSACDSRDVVGKTVLCPNTRGNGRTASGASPSTELGERSVLSAPEEVGSSELKSADAEEPDVEQADERLSDDYDCDSDDTFPCGDVSDCDWAEDDDNNGEAHAGREGDEGSKGLNRRSDDAQHQLETGAGAEIAGKEGDDEGQGDKRQIEAGKSPWTIQMVQQPALCEVLERRHVLYLVQLPYPTSESGFSAVWDPWTMEGTSHLEASANTMRIRMPRVRREDGELIVQGKEEMEHDFATAVARMNMAGSCRCCRGRARGSCWSCPLPTNREKAE